MARFGVGAKTSAGTVQWPILSLFSSVNNQCNIREIGIFNTTTTAFDVRLARIASGPGTPGAGLTETCLDNPALVGGCMGFTTYTAGTPTLTDLGYRASIGAAIGAAMVWTFGGEGIEIAAASGTTTGVCIAIENGAGQAAQCYFIYDE